MMLLISLACAGEPTPKEDALAVREDLASLEKHIAVPEGWVAVRWVARAKGEPGLGPTDLVLLAEFTAPPVEGLDGTGHALVTPDAELASALGLDGTLSGQGLATAPFETSMWTGGFAVLVDDNVYVELHSR